METLFKSGVIATGGLVGLLFGGWDTLLQVVVGLAVLDFISGLLAAGVKGELKSKIGFRGIAKKVMIFLLIAAAHWIDLVIGTNAMFREAVIFFFIANELLSLIENAGNIGIQIPAVLENAVAVLKGKSERKE